MENDPLTRGGQSRTDKEIQESGEIFYASCVLGCFILAACCAVAVWMGMKA